ncbi:MAG TPA: MFS transporter [Bryobacteraceae bacterium]|nr:MFS transporter [Bryobacteraceae bacterium]
MSWSGFRKAGHLPTLAASFLYFDVSFMAWVILGPLAPYIGETFRLSATEKGFFVALPLLAGSFFRPLLGAVGDRIGGRRAGLIGMTLTLIPLLIGWRFATAPVSLYPIAFLLGVAGASFAVALPLASRWFPPEYQGLAMGIAGAGNSGTLLSTLLAPRLAAAVGWRNTFGFALLPVTAALIVFAALARESPRRSAAVTGRDYWSALKQADAGWLCYLYCMTFGGFVGLASFLTLYFHEQYGLSKVHAGDYTSIAVIAGSFLRPVGGLISDRVGGYRVLLAVLGLVAICLFAISSAPPVTIGLLLLTLVMALLGIGNGAVFQILPLRFPDKVGIMTGVVGAAGGFGGFLLPSLLGWIKDRTGQYGAGIAICGAVALVGMCVLLRLGARWRRSWTGPALWRTGVFARQGGRTGERAAA